MLVFEYVLDGGTASVDSFTVFVRSFVEAGNVVPGRHWHSHVHCDWLGWCSGEDKFQVRHLSCEVLHISYDQFVNFDVFFVGWE